MTEFPEHIVPAPPRAVETSVRTVVVLDLVAYSTVASMLEQNAGSSAVAELNRQIQSLIQSCLAELPSPGPYILLSDTGDGAILLFDLPADGHRFGELIQRNAERHNQGLTESSAKRYFRVGITTGELAELRPGVYAGATISNAVRLQTAASPGELIADLATWNALPDDLRKCYKTQSTVRGKRSELFHVRRYPVVAGPAKPIALPSLPPMSRRNMLGITAGAVAATAATVWIEHDRLEDWLHPLPIKRFIALYVWPKPAEDLSGIVHNLISSIQDRISRAESRDKQLLVMVPNDPLLGGSASDADTPQRLANALGANLVLTASSQKVGDRVDIGLQLTEAESQKNLRRRLVSSSMTRLSGLDHEVVEAAARIIGLPPAERRQGDRDELAAAPPDTYRAYVEARQLYDQPNETGIDAAVEKLQQLTNEAPQFSLGFSLLALAYITRFRKTTDPDVLHLAGINADHALSLNPNSTQALLARAKIFAFTGKTDEALNSLENARKEDPSNPDVLLYKGTVFKILNNLPAEEEIYRQITKTRVNYWPAYNELGTVLMRRAKYSEAADAFQTASQIVPKVSLPISNLGMVYLTMGQNDKAKPLLEKSVALSPRPEAYVGLGNIAFEAKDYRQALGFYQKASELNPKDHAVLRDIGDCYFQLKQPDKVRETFTQAAAILAKNLEINSKRGPDWMVLSFYDAKTGNFAKAKTDIANAEAHGASDLESQFTKAQTLAVTGEKEQSLQLVLDCLAKGLSPVNVDLAVDLGEIRSDLRYQQHLKNLGPLSTHSS